jgi:hypothetical protein
VCVIEPGRALVVEIGESALLWLGLVLGTGDEAIRVAEHRFWDTLHPFGGVQPVVAHLGEVLVKLFK